MSQPSLSTFAVYVVGAVVGLVVGLRAWPALGRTLFAYAFAARIPVALVMLVPFSQLGHAPRRAAALPRWLRSRSGSRSASFPR
jgi:hypothetical protein